MEDLQTIEKALQERALKLEKERLSAHESAMKEIAEARASEENRRKAAREIIEAQQDLRKKRKAEAKTAADEEALEERRLQTLMEQEQNKVQVEIDFMLARTEAMAKKLIELEHAEEMAKKELRDLILNNTQPDTGERVMENPLQRFFQVQE